MERLSVMLAKNLVTHFQNVHIHIGTLTWPNDQIAERPNRMAERPNRPI